MLASVWATGYTHFTHANPDIAAGDTSSATTALAAATTTV
jgi:hypothetical protein